MYVTIVLFNGLIVIFDVCDYSICAHVSEHDTRRMTIMFMDDNVFEHKTAIDEKPH